MVSSGEVSSGLSDFKSVMDNYSSAVDGIGGNWEGDSHDSIIPKIEAFKEEALSTITAQMEAFSEACGLFAQYKAKKEEWEEKCAERDSLANQPAYDANNNPTYAKRRADELDKIIPKLKEEMDQLDKQIRAALDSAQAGTVEVKSSSVSGVSSAASQAKDDANANVTQANYTGGAPVTNATMQSIADSARANSGSRYNNNCEAWVEEVWTGATGGERVYENSAYSAWKNYGVSTSRDNIPVGAMVYGSGWPYSDDDEDYTATGENPYGHVAIYVGNGEVADQDGVKNLDDWANSQPANCHGTVGYLGWGWYKNVDLSKDGVVNT